MKRIKNNASLTPKAGGLKNKFANRKTSMLILSRKLGESVRIDDNVRVMILEVKGKQVRVGIEAPDEIKVHRAEIYDRIQQQKLAGEYAK